MNYNIQYITVNLPDTVKACTVPNCENDGYIIILNSKLSSSAQKRAIMHELQHINKNDCYDDTETAETLESRIAD